MNICNLFQTKVEEQPEHTAIAGPGDTQMCTYKQLFEEITAASRILQSAGVGAETCVGLHYQSSKQYIVFTYAVWQCGGCVVPIPIELAQEEKYTILADIGLNFIITSQKTQSLFDKIKTEKARPLSAEALLVSVKPFKEHPPDFFKENPAFLRFSSGTTGNSKGVVLSHETIYDRIQAANLALKIGPNDRIVWLLSMSYHFTVSIVSYLNFGATILLCKNHFGPTVVEVACKCRGTIIYGSPVHYELMASEKSQSMLPDLRLALSTAASLETKTQDTFYHRFQKPLHQAYGIIEVGLPCINIDAPLTKKGSVGKVLSSYEMEFEDVGLGQDLKLIKVRGKGLLDAYYEPWQPQDKIMKDGWFITGDLGMIDKENYVFINGRSKEVINVGGMKFFPQEVEKVLESHPSVKEACVVSNKDSHWQEIPCAYLVADIQLEPQKLQDYCAKFLASYKIPKEFHYLNELKRTASGKLIRQKWIIEKG